MSKRSSSFSAADSSKGVLQCRVKLLDGSDFLLELNKKAEGKVVFDQVLRRLGLSEKDYFGLEYEDDQKLPQWLDLSKAIKKQLKKPPYRLQFKVRFYPLDPMMSHSSCRTHFYQQLRKELVEGKLKCPEQLAPSIISYILQADLGDFESTERDIEFMADERLLINESKQVQEEIVYFHQIHKGMNPQQAVKGFLRKVRDLETYGSIFFGVRFEDDSRQLGISPTGVAVYRRETRVLGREWPAVLQLSFKSKKLMVEVQQDNHGPDLQLTFELDSVKATKDVWRQCAEYAKYYSEPHRRLREDPETIRSPGAISIDHQQQPPGHAFQFPQPHAQPNPDPESASNLATKVQKAKSLPRRLPGEDPIAAALMLHKGQKGQISELSSPTSPASTSMSEEALSPKSDANQAGPEIPVFQDEIPPLPVQQNHTQDYRSPFSGEKQTPPMSRDHHMERDGRQQHLNEHSYPSHAAQTVDYLQAGHADYQQQMYSSSTPQLSNGGRSRSTDVPEDLSQEPGDDMDDSLLDLAAELGDEEDSSRSELNRSGQLQEVGVAGGTSSASERSKSSPHSPHPRHYHSSTLPPSFTNGHQPQLNQQDNEEELPPPKPPRNDTQPARSSPHVLGSSHTGGREHKKKRNGQQLVQNWIQDQQQHREYYSSSQESGSGRGSHDSPMVPHHVHRHHLQPSPERRGERIVTTHEHDGRQREREPGRQQLSHDGQFRSRDHHYRSRDHHVTHNEHASNSTTHGRVPEQNRQQQQTELNQQKEHGYPLPTSPAPPPYMSPSPDSQQAQLLQQLVRPSQAQNHNHQHEHHHHTGLVREGERSSDQDPHQFDSKAPNPRESPKQHDMPNTAAVRYSTTSEDLNQAIEDLINEGSALAVTTEPVGTSSVGTGRSNSTSTSRTRPSPPNTHREAPWESLSRETPQDVASNEVDMRVERAVRARNERTNFEKSLRQSQKAFNKRLATTNEDYDVPRSSSRHLVAKDTGRVEQAAMESQVAVMKKLDLAAFAKEPIAVDPRNFLKADSPIYDRLENVFSDGGDGERAASSQTSSSTPLSVGLTGSRSTVPEIVAPLSPPGSSASSRPHFTTPPPDLGNILQEVMETNNLPPPPPHLIALSQELEGNSQRTTDELMSRKKPSPSSRNAAQQPSTSGNTSSSTRPAKKEAQFDPKLFLKQGLIVPSSTLEASGSDDHMRSLSACDTTRLPPEIARFMTRVRPGAQPVDNHPPNSKFTTERELLVKPLDEVRRPHSAETPSTRSPRISSVSPTYDSPRVDRIEVSEGIVRHQPSPDVERVTVPDVAANLESPSPEATEKVNVESTRTVSPLLTASSVTEQNMSSSSYATYDVPRSVMNSEMERQGTDDTNGVENGRSVSAQPKKASSFSESSTTTASKYSYQRYRQEASQKKQQQTSGFPNKSLSLPHGQQPPSSDMFKFGGGMGPHSPTQSSAPTTPITHSDLVSPSYSYPQPQTNRTGSVDGGGTSNRSQFQPIPSSGMPATTMQHTRANNSHQANPRSHNYKPQRQQYYGQDVRRTQTFSSGHVSGRPVAQASQQFHERSPMSPVEGEDSLPNSPTYFTKYPPNQDRGTPSPNTQATNESFQEHLNSLSSHPKHGRKMRILHWMQQTDNFDPRGGHPLIRDPGTHVPTQPYQKQPHVYATANDPDLEQQDQDRSSSRASQQTSDSYRHDYGGSGRRHTGVMQQQSYTVRPPSQQHQHQQQQQQQQQPSRERLHTFPYSNNPPQAHRQPQRAQGERGGYNSYYPPTTRTGPPRGGQTSTQAAGSSGIKSQRSYPTAKFGKDFYVIDV